MNRIVPVLALFGFLLAGFSTLHAQVPVRQGAAPPPEGGEIHGSVVDADGEPIYGASVAAWSKADSSLVAGDIAHQDGAFRVQGLQPGTYYLQVTSIGYDAHRTKEFTIAASSRESAGVIRLLSSPVRVEGIEVTVERPALVIEPDRNSYSAKEVAPAAATASEVLEATPSVQVDADGKVSLRGNENVAVQINGRPAPVQGEQLGAYLRQLPANVIERVEVVPTPSARYDPEGMAGIINIVMKQNTDLGMSGGVTLGAASPSGRYNASGNFGYQRGQATFFGTYGFNADERTIVGINDRDRFDALRALLSRTEQDVDEERSRNGHNISTTFDYRLSEKDVLSNALSLNRRSSDEASLNAYTELGGDGSMLDQYNRLRDGESKGLVLDYTLAFKHTVEARRHELSAEVRLNRDADDDGATLWRQPLEGTDPVTRSEAERRETDELTRKVTAQVDYTLPLGEKTKLETGYKGDARWLDNEYILLEDDLGTGEWIESELSNAFEFDEQVQAAYGVISHVAGKFELQGGLRAEYASRDFVLADEGQNYPYSYGSFFPSGVVSYNLSDASQAKISYSRRIRRPESRELNPFPTFFDVQNVFIGNPELDPEYTDAIELGFNHQAEWGTFQLSPFYRRTTDVIRFIVDTADEVDGREVTSVSFENLATGNSWGTDVNASLEWRDWLKGMASFNVFKMVTEGGSESSLSSNAVTWSTRLNVTADLTPALSLQGMYFYRAPMEFESGSFSSWKMSSFTLRQKLAGDKASLSLRLVDPFDTMGFRVEAGDDDVFQITERKFGARALHLTFQYSFGQAPKVRQPRPDQGAEPQGGFPQ